MKKRLNIDQIQSELRGGSAFFPGYKVVTDPASPASKEPEPVEPPPPAVREEPKHERKSQSPPVSPHRDATPLSTAPAQQEAPDTPDASTLASKQESLQASYHASMLALPPETLETIRKIVKNPGKEEVLYVRLSKEEKDKLADVSYTYKRQGIRTSDNEVVRVAINMLLEDYKTNGANSLLAIIIASLHA